MSPKRIISTPLAPQPIGPYSQAVQVGNTVYLSGQIGMNVRTNEMVTGPIRDEAQQAFTNMKAVVEASGAKMSDVVKVNIFIRNFNDFPAINDVMKEFFQSPFPARSTVGVAELPKNARVEIESIVVIE
uniref:2-iminobutanoate/2-iminopropanoate deaminase n=1 Tax=Dermatophagoides farinae TaxID=6954 RepID=RIDA_DERFA|nr:RecName: Full=2-iminobutanoate/2-iminopropanoate deaminase; AltName: Full=Allergen Der f 34; AltName: Full=Enamine/imine deaminase; AltName: Allergen=Der f 34.0101 [Dermatophagoides farinae]BAV90601.1 enamine/imine deaminase [Dermatophagoides farinae]